VQSPATLKQLVQVDSIHAFQFLAGVKQRVDAALAPATPTIAPGGVPHPTATPPQYDSGVLATEVPDA
jgi:hypothetical protein